MQLYALDKNEKLTFVGHAQRKGVYHCVECRAPVRVRGGVHRRLHFYHSEGRRVCGQSGKGLAHLQTQLALQRALGEESCSLEQPFPKISRIADVVHWPSKRVFEVQCSPISLQEVQERNRDYGREGWSVQWVLHDQRFNRLRLGEAELWLRQQGALWSSVTATGEGEIYDQPERIKKGKRVRRGKPAPVQVGESFTLSSREVRQLPSALREPFLLRGSGYVGDLVYRWHQGDEEVRTFPWAEPPTLWLVERLREGRALCAHLYRVLFFHLLESFSQGAKLSQRREPRSHDH